MAVYRHPIVATEIDSIAAHIAQDSPDAAVRFVEAVEKEFEFLQTISGTRQPVGIAKAGSRGTSLYRDPRV